jgi:hypothetical protein
MAVGVLAAAPEFTRQVYDNITERMYGHSPMRADEAPEGLILHSAGQGEQGFMSMTCGSPVRPSTVSWRKSLARQWQRRWADRHPKEERLSSSRSMFWSPLAEPTTSTRNS